MKKFISFTYLVLTSLISKAQNSNYYSSAHSLSGDELKKELHNIIDDHETFKYTGGSPDVWDILKDTDRDTVNPENVILIYSGRSVNGAQEYNNRKGWTREHVWAKSRGDFDTDPPAGSDVHALRPLDPDVNGFRSNKNFDNCENCKEVLDGGFKTGSRMNKKVFEVPNEVKGDVARMVFYMAVRYEGDVNNEPDLELTEEYLDKVDKSPLHSRASTLLEWHRNDPVSTWEQRRNDIIFERYQKNRNPFIDHPELAEYLWGELTQSPWVPKNTKIVPLNNDSTNAFWPKTTTKQFQLPESISSFSLYDEAGNNILRVSSIETINLSALRSGTYLMIYDKNGVETRSKVTIQ